MLTRFLILRDEEERMQDSSTSFASQHMSSVLYWETFYIAELGKERSFEWYILFGINETRLSHISHRDTQSVIFSFLWFLWFYKNNSAEKGF